MSRFWIILFSALILYACETPDPGCLDTIAQNYDVFAASPCDDCCEYPTVRLNVRYKFDTLESFSFSRLYEYIGFDSIGISKIQMIFSDFTFYENGMPNYVVDTIEGRQPTIYDSFTLIDQAKRNEAIGQTNYLKLIDSVSFTAGLVPQDLVNLAPITEVDESSNFSSVISQMYVDSIAQLFQGRVELSLDDSMRLIEFKTLPTVNLGFSLDEELLPSTDWSIPIYIDMRRLVDGVLSEQSNEMIAEIISGNVLKSISKRE